MVYYKRESSHEWHGPAKIIGRDEQRYLLKHGGTYHRVHPCKMQHVTDSHQNTTQPETQSSATQTIGNMVEEKDPLHEQSTGVGNEDEDDDSRIADLQLPIMTPPPTPQHAHQQDHHIPEELVNQGPVMNDEIKQYNVEDMTDDLPSCD